MSTDASMLESFEHVVVLMLENRSFDNILGYLYPDGVPSDAPLGKTFEGVSGRNLSNPDKSGTPIPVSRGTDYRQPYPDPGEEYRHVNEQLFGSSPPDMQGFVVDYYNTLEALTELKPERKAWPGSPSVQSKEIMKCFEKLRTRDSWPDWESYPGPTASVPEVADVDQSTIPLNDLQKSILEATRGNLGLGRDADGEVTALESAADARQLLQEASEKGLLDHD